MLEKASAHLKRYRALRLPGDWPRAAVLMPIINHPAPSLLLTRRNTRLNAHPGQVAFPGGKRDRQDTSLEACALRESFEEIGLEAFRVTLIGRLSERLSTGGVAVTPFVGLIEPPLVTRANPDEIEAIFDIPLAELLHDPRTHTDVICRHDQTLYVPSYAIEGHTLWGLSAMMVVELLNVAFEIDIGLDRYPAGSRLRYLP